MTHALQFGNHHREWRGREVSFPPHAAAQSLLLGLRCGLRRCAQAALVLHLPCQMLTTAAAPPAPYRRQSRCKPLPLHLHQNRFALTGFSQASPDPRKRDVGIAMIAPNGCWLLFLCHSFGSFHISSFVRRLVMPMRFASRIRATYRRLALSSWMGSIF